MANGITRLAVAKTQKAKGGMDMLKKAIASVAKPKAKKK